MGTEHDHCCHCFNLLCKSSTCPIIRCSLHCGAAFHNCKLTEHEYLCARSCVTCINVEYGCPAKVRRGNMSTHLKHCPANIVMCTMEWNRWPVYSEEHKSRLPFVQDHYHARYSQLEVALAFRDQQVLNASLQVPKSVRKSLRNSLTKKFPAVPILYSEKGVQPDTQNRTIRHSPTPSTDEDCDAPWHVAKEPAGLQASICNQLFCRKNVNLGNNSVTNTAIFDNDKKADDSTINDVTGATVCTTCNHYSHDIVESEYTTSVTMANNSNPLEKEPCIDSMFTYEMGLKALKSKGNQLAELARKETISNKVLDKRVSQDVKQTANLKLREVLALRLQMEVISRYQCKPNAMYTFMCAQYFRRDEYGQHFKNVHSEIHGGLNGWIEHRCPLAQYGCTYHVRRIEPTLGHRQNVKVFSDTKFLPATLVYHDHLGSFGVKPLDINRSSNHTNALRQASLKEGTPEMLTSHNFDQSVDINCQKASLSPLHNSDNPDRLTSLPHELHRHIFQYLDSFSLSNLSLTCHTMRDVCHSVLSKYGMVIVEWEKSLLNEKPSWNITHQRWLFSTSFNEVPHWRFCSNQHMSFHLQTCAFNERCDLPNVPVPVCVPKFLTNVSDSISSEAFSVLKKMYPDWNING